MKKNKMMRAASFLLVAVLLTTSVISGTFAKYVTTATGSDSARVAHWGITMKTEDGAFKANYDDTVIAGNGSDLIVAPGTDGSNTYEVYGKPEVDYIITFVGTEMTSDIYLEAETYTYYDTDVEYVGMGGTVASDYYPLDWKVTISAPTGVVAGGWTDGTARTFGKLSDAMTALAAATITYDANETCDAVVTIAWEWDFNSSTGTISNDEYTSNDVCDTILGDLIAGNANLQTSAAEHTTLAYTVKMTATQID